MQLRTSLFVGSEITTLSLQLDLEVDPCFSPLLPGCSDERVKKSTRLTCKLLDAQTGGAWNGGGGLLGELGAWW